MAWAGSNGSARPRSAAVAGMNWAMPCAPLGLTAPALKLLSCHSSLVKNPTGSAWSVGLDESAENALRALRRCRWRHVGGIDRRPFGCSRRGRNTSRDRQNYQGGDCQTQHDGTRRPAVLAPTLNLPAGSRRAAFAIHSNAERESFAIGERQQESQRPPVTSDGRARKR